MSEATASPKPIRVRTPGKHMVVFGAVAAAMVAAAFNVVGDARNPDISPTGTSAPVSARSRDSESIPLKEFLVDLSPDRTGRAAYLRLTASAQAAPATADSVAAALRNRQAEIDERLSFLFRGLSSDDFAGEDGMARVKAEMLRRVNIVIAPDAVADIVITDLIIQ